MKVLVCGGRGFKNWLWLKAELDRLHAERGFTELMHGAAPGADTLANSWAIIAGVPIRWFIAAWQSEGHSAGPRRNQRMLREGQPSLVIAFPGGDGTADMVRRARKAGVEVLELQPP